MRERRGKQTAEFNNKHKETKYSIGDRVLVKALNVSNPEKKLIAKFMELYEGPYGGKADRVGIIVPLEIPR